MKKRIVTLAIMGLMVVSSYADGGWTLSLKEGGKWNAYTEYETVTSTFSIKDGTTVSKFTRSLGAGSYTFSMKEANNNKSSDVSFVLTSAKEVSFWGAVPSGKGYAIVMCNAVEYPFTNGNFTSVPAYTPKTYGDVSTSVIYFNPINSSYADNVSNFQVKPCKSLVAGSLYCSGKDNTDYQYTNVDQKANTIKKCTLSYPDFKFTIESVEIIDVKISSVGCATFVAPGAVTISESDDVKAYTLEYINNKLIANEIFGKTIPANTPVLLNATPGTYSFSFDKSTMSFTDNSETVSNKTYLYHEDVTSSDNVLKGTMQCHYAPNGSYVLQNGTHGVGFYQVDVDNYLVNTMHCYIPSSAIPAGARSLSIVFDDSETTGIADVKGQKEDVRGDIFNLSGQRVGKDYKGVVIKNGRKMIQK